MIGLNGICFREDYIMEKIKDKLQVKVRRLECKNGSLELTHPFVVKYNDYFLLYSIEGEEKSIAKGEKGEQIV